MPDTFDDGYLARLRANDATLTEVELIGQNIDDEGAGRLAEMRK